MDNINIGWPEGIYLSLVLLSLIVNASLNGKQKNGEYNFGLALIASALMLLLLYWGEFFK